MSTPAKKQSKTRSRQRRAHKALDKKNLVPCVNCGKNKMPHRACPNCRQYKGRKIADK